VEVARVQLKRVYGEISKVEELDDGTLIVEGVASSEAVDSEGETILADAMREALPDYLKFGAIREMHQPTVAAGTAISAEVREDGKTYLKSHVVDPVAVKKVLAGVYKGFSIGGKVLERLGKIIKRLLLVEISLVDRPANPEALFQLVKMEAAMPEADPVAPAADPVKAAETPAAAPAPVVPAPAAPVEPVQPSAPATEPVTKGMAAYDAGCAIDAIIQLQYLLSKEQGEDHPEAAAQLAALDAAIRALKTFVASEIQESDPESVTMADKVAKAVAGFEALKAPRPIAKAGAKFSKATKAALAAVHDKIDACSKAMGDLGYKTADDDVSSADAGGDLQKRMGEQTELLEKADAALKDLLAKNGDLSTRLTKAEQDLAERKGALKAVPVEKSQDRGSVSAVEKGGGEEEDSVSLVKRAQSAPVPFAQFVNRSR
jgi:hypothetical protein